MSLYDIRTNKTGFGQSYGFVDELSVTAYNDLHLKL